MSDTNPPKRVSLTMEALKLLSKHMAPTSCFLVFDEDGATLPQFYASGMEQVMAGEDGAMTDNMLMGLCFARFFDDANFREMCIGLINHDLVMFEAGESASTANH